MQCVDDVVIAKPDVSWKEPAKTRDPPHRHSLSLNELITIRRRLLAATAGGFQFFND